METLQPVPKLGEKYWFYADDRIKIETEHLAEIVGIYTLKEADKKLVYIYESHAQELVGYPLLDLWNDEIPLAFWILSDETDYIIEAKIPDLCPQNVYFARTVDGGWHAFEVYSSLQFGILDVTENLHKALHKLYAS